MIVRALLGFRPLRWARHSSEAPGARFTLGVWGSLGIHREGFHMSIHTALRALGRRPARRSSISTRRQTDSRIRRAASFEVQRLEGRTLLSALPNGVNASSDSVYTLTGDAGSGYTLTFSAGAVSLDTNLGAGASFSLVLTGTANASINSPESLSALPFPARPGRSSVPAAAGPRAM